MTGHALKPGKAVEWSLDWKNSFTDAEVRRHPLSRIGCAMTDHSHWCIWDSGAT